MRRLIRMVTSFPENRSSSEQRIFCFTSIVRKNCPGEAESYVRISWKVTISFSQSSSYLLRFSGSDKISYAAQISWNYKSIPNHPSILLESDRPLYLDGTSLPSSYRLFGFDSDRPTLRYRGHCKDRIHRPHRGDFAEEGEKMTVAVFPLYDTLQRARCAALLTGKWEKNV